MREPPVRPASNRRGGWRVGWDRWGWPLVEKRSSLPLTIRGVAARLALARTDWPTRLAVTAAVTTNDVLDGHVGLDVECLDRIYLNGYAPNLQVGAQVASFMTAHLDI